MRFLEQVRDVLIISMIANFVWFAVFDKKDIKQKLV